jgi:tRNA(Arg) A34 adenosine deaminase TadA
MEISNRIRRYFELAKQQAWQSDHVQKHGAVLVRGSAILNTSYNRSHFNRFASRFKKNPHIASCHAEIKAILGIARERTEGSDIYVIRINNFGDFMLSHPCEMCISCCKYCGIKRIIYSIDNETCGIIRL